MTEILITSSALIAVLLLLRQCFRRRLSPRLQYALWGLLAGGALVCAFAGENVPKDLYFPTLVYAGAAQNAPSFTVMELAGSTRCRPVLTVEEPVLANHLEGSQLWLAIQDGEQTRVERRALDSGSVEQLGAVADTIRRIAPCKSGVFLYGAAGDIWFLFGGTAQRCPVTEPQRQILTGAENGCYYVGYDRENLCSHLFFLSADTLESSIVCREIPHTEAVFTDGEALYFTDGTGCYQADWDVQGGWRLCVELSEFGTACQAALAWDGCLLVVEPPRDGSCAMTLWDLQRGRVISCGSVDFRPESVRDLSEMVFFSEEGFVLVEGDWFAGDASGSNRYRFFPWPGRYAKTLHGRTLRVDG